MTKTQAQNKAHRNDLTSATDVTAALCERGWSLKWARHTSVTDEYGNIAHIAADHESLMVTFEWAVPGGIVETLHLGTDRPVSHIVAVVEALAMPPEV